LIAFSQSPVTVATVDGTSIASLRSGLDTILQSVGWTRVSVTGGFRYTLTSRQEFSASCWIRDLGDDLLGLPCLTIQFGSEDGSIMGRPHLLGISPLRTHYDVIASGPQFFVALRGYTNQVVDGEQTFDVRATSVCGGIPYVPIDTCGEPIEEITDVWWSSGAGNGESFRSGWRHDDTADWSACYNGEVFASGAPQEARLRLSPVAQPDWDLFYSRQQTQWMDETPLYFEPLIAWGFPSARVRAQIYDAMWASKDVPLDSALVTFERNPDTGLSYAESFLWRSWSHYFGDMSHGAPGTYYGCLYLLTVAPTSFLESNYAY
jgi:hypothetical protein